MPRAWLDSWSGEPNWPCQLHPKFPIPTSLVRPVVGNQSRRTAARAACGCEFRLQTTLPLRFQSSDESPNGTRSEHTCSVPVQERCMTKKNGSKSWQAERQVCVGFAFTRAGQYSELPVPERSDGGSKTGASGFLYEYYEILSVRELLSR